MVVGFRLHPRVSEALLHNCSFEIVAKTLKNLGSLTVSSGERDPEREEVDQ